MSNTSGDLLSAGFQRAVIFALDANGYPAATGSQAYEGLDIIGANLFNMNTPDVTKVPHTGQDRILATQFFPPKEGVTAQLTMDGSSTELIALLTGVKEYALAEKTFVSWMTDQQGNEPDVGLLLVQAALDASSKLGQRHFFVVPSGRAVPKPGSFDENAYKTIIDVALNPTTKHIWGEALTTGVEGAGETAFDEGDAAKRPNLVAFKGNNSTTIFLLPTSKPATSTAKMKVWVDGVVASPTLAVDKITFSPAPGTGEMIVLLYEY